MHLEDLTRFEERVWCRCAARLEGVAVGEGVVHLSLLYQIVERAVTRLERDAQLAVWQPLRCTEADHVRVAHLREHPRLVLEAAFDAAAFAREHRRHVRLLEHPRRAWEPTLRRTVHPVYSDARTLAELLKRDRAGHDQ